MSASSIARLRATCAVCGRDKHPNEDCSGRAVDWNERKLRALAWGKAQQAEHDKADQARREGRQYTARRIDYDYAD
jgi:hypothetical protein